MHEAVHQSQIWRAAEGRRAAPPAEVPRRRRRRALAAGRYRRAAERRATRCGGRSARHTSRVRGPPSTTGPAARPNCLKG